MKGMLICFLHFIFQFQLVWTSSARIQMSIGVQKNWPYKKAMQHQLSKLREHGSLEHLEFKYHKTTENCIEDDTDADLSLSIFKLVLPFLILSFGMIASMIIVSFESF